MGEGRGRGEGGGWGSLVGQTLYQLLRGELLVKGLATGLIVDWLRRLGAAAQLIIYHKDGRILC